MNRFNNITPGPWHIGFGDGSGESYITSGDLTSAKFINVVVGGNEDGYNIPQGVTWAPDRELISEAPTLLKVLRNLVGCDVALDTIVDCTAAIKASNPVALDNGHPLGEHLQLARLNRAKAIVDAVKLLTPREPS